jgi:formate dehydrogenase subunit beta
MQSFKVDVQDHDLLTAFTHLAERILSLKDIDAILVPKRHPRSAMVMPTLVSDPDQLTGMDPLAPAYAINGAKVVSKLTRKSSGHRLAVLLRPCEIRAFIELVKLNQGAVEEIVIIGSDCLGAMNNRAYLKFAGDDPISTTQAFYKGRLQNSTTIAEEELLAPACCACDQPLALGADVAVLLYGVNVKQQLILQAQSDKGHQFLKQLAYPPIEVPDTRDQWIEELTQKRIQYRDHLFEKTRESIDSLEKMSAYLAACVNCYNCRVACPVCYCRECVFVTDVFEHEPFQYLNWTRRKGAVKLPTDTLFYHLTRLTHMSTACVGCGQCSNACPNDIAVMELFRTIAHQTQAAFDYSAGADINQKPPLTEFKEVEFEDMVGITD